MRLAAEAEIERLRKEVVETNKAYADANYAREQLQAENERLSRERTKVQRVEALCDEAEAEWRELSTDKRGDTAPSTVQSVTFPSLGGSTASSGIHSQVSGTLALVPRATILAATSRSPTTTVRCARRYDWLTGRSTPGGRPPSPAIRADGPTLTGRSVKRSGSRRPKPVSFPATGTTCGRSPARTSPGNDTRKPSPEEERDVTVNSATFDRDRLC